MSPKVKAKSKASSPLADADMHESVAAELGLVGVVDYKTLRPSSENLNKTEEAEGAALREDVYKNAIDDDAVEDEVTAAAIADAALKLFVFKKKLSKAFAKYNKKLSQAADAAQVVPPPAAENPPMADGDQAPPPAASPGEKKKAAYQEVIVAAYNRVTAHRVFMDVASLPPNPIQEDTSGDCGVQAR